VAVALVAMLSFANLEAAAAGVNVTEIVQDAPGARLAAQSFGCATGCSVLLRQPRSHLLLQRRGRVVVRGTPAKFVQAADLLGRGPHLRPELPPNLPPVASRCCRHASDVCGSVGTRPLTQIWGSLWRLSVGGRASLNPPSPADTPPRCRPGSPPAPTRASGSRGRAPPTSDPAVRGCRPCR
jgi:hypothetical protein